MENLEQVFEAMTLEEKEALENKVALNDGRHLYSPSDGDNEIFAKIFGWLSYYRRGYYEILGICRRVPDRNMSTMGVTVEAGRFYLFYNPEFLRAHPVRQMRWVLIHEAMHILLHHCTARNIPSNAKNLHWLHNIAADMAINPRIKTDSELESIKSKDGGEFGVFPRDYGFMDDQSMETYFAMLEKKFEGGGGSSAGGEDGKGTHDDHSGWKEDKVAAERIRSEVNRISAGSLWGNVPADEVARIQAAQRSELKWYELLRLELGRYHQFKSMQTRTRRHRIHGWDAPGNTSAGRCNVLTVWDTSGSVPDEDLAIAAGEVNRLASKIGTVFFTTFDTRLHHVRAETWTKRHTITVKGRGGTDFNPIVDAVKTGGIWAGKYKVVVIFTDGECHHPVLPMDVNFIWVIFQGGTVPQYKQVNVKCVQVKR